MSNDVISKGIQLCTWWHWGSKWLGKPFNMDPKQIIYVGSLPGEDRGRNKAWELCKHKSICSWIYCHLAALILT